MKYTGQLLCQLIQRRPPRGGRGLKYLVRQDLSIAGKRSPPSRGAWIEIRRILYSAICRGVAPLAGGVD